jgi:hypothetical protein
MIGRRDEPSSSYAESRRHQSQYLGVEVSITAIALVIVVLRLLTRYLIVRSPGLDDCAIAGSMVSLPFLFAGITAYHVQVLMMIESTLGLFNLKNGIAMHIRDIPRTANLAEFSKVSGNPGGQTDDG